MLYTEQLAAFENIKDFLFDPSSQVFILKGYAGAGKTTLIKHICDFLATIEVPFLLTAPTGRAARIMSEKTKLPSKTIHSIILICNSTFLILLSSILTKKLDIYTLFFYICTMKITEIIGYYLDRLPNGYVFTYEEILNKVNSTKKNKTTNNKEAVIKALNRITAAGKLSKLSKGRFYKPEKSSFGNLKPNNYQIVKDLLEDNGKLIGYLTGYTVYNQLGLTTQISNIIQIGKNIVRPSFYRSGYKISFILQKNKITSNNIPLLQILDSIKLIKKIPDTNISDACIRFLEIIKQLTESDKKDIVKLALKYPPSTRALLGALLDQLGSSKLTIPLLNSLNPITSYKINGADKILTKANKWNII